MRQDTYTAQAVKAAEDKINNDKACKKILASKEILAYICLVILRLGESPTEEKTLGMLQTLFLGSMIPEERLKKLEEEYQLNISEEIGEEVRNMCSYSQVIEDRGVEKGIEKGILIYRTLLETKSIPQTVAKTKEPADKVKRIAEQYQVEVSE